MWDAFYNKSSQSCTSFCKKKTDLLSVEYRNYIRRDVLHYLDQYPMRQSNQKTKKGSPNTRNKRPQSVQNAKPLLPIDCKAGIRPKDLQKPTNTLNPLCKIGTICECNLKPKKVIKKAPKCLKGTSQSQSDKNAKRTLATDSNNSDPVSQHSKGAQSHIKSEVSSCLKDSVDFALYDHLVMSYETSQKEEELSQKLEDSSQKVFDSMHKGDEQSVGTNSVSCKNYPVCEQSIEKISPHAYVPPWKIHKVRFLY